MANKEKKINTRIQNKHDLEVNWLQASGFTPMAGEIIVYDRECDNNGKLLEGVTLPKGRTSAFKFERIKVGDGTTNVNDLPFVGVGEAAPENGEIFNDYKNNIAGGKGFEITEKAQTSNGEGYYTLKGYAQYVIDHPGEASYAVGDTWSAHIKNAYDFWGTIIGVDGDIVYVSNYVEGAADTDPWTFWVYTKSNFGNLTIGNLAHAEGKNTTAIGQASHAEGRDTIANENYSHAEGRQTKAAYAGHSEGRITEARGMYGHAENFRTIAGDSAHAEGSYRVALGQHSHAEGLGRKNTAVKDQYGGNPADETIGAIGAASHVEGVETTAIGKGAHAEGYKTIAHNNYSHAEGQYNKVTKSIYTPLNLSIGTPNNNAGVFINDNGQVEYDLDYTDVSNLITMRHFGFAETFSGSVTLQFNFKSDVEFTYNLHAISDLGKVTTSGGKKDKGSGTAYPTNGYVTITKTINFDDKTKPYLSFRITGNSGVNSIITLLSANIIIEEIDTDIIHSVGNGTSDANRNNAFVVYKDGHAEVDKMGENDKSIATKGYVDKVTKESAGLQRVIVDALPSVENADSNIIYMIRSNEGTNYRRWKVFTDQVVGLSSYYENFEEFKKDLENHNNEIILDSDSTEDPDDAYNTHINSKDFSFVIATSGGYLNDYRKGDRVKFLNITKIDDEEVHYTYSPIEFYADIEIYKPYNIYNEYIFTDGNFELLGTTEVDLTNYATKSEVSEQYIKKEDGKGLSSNDFTDNFKTKLEELDDVGKATLEGGEIFNTYEDITLTEEHYNPKVVGNTAEDTVSGKLLKNKTFSEGTTVTGASNSAGCLAFRIIDSGTATYKEEHLYFYDVDYTTEAQRLYDLWSSQNLATYYSAWLFKADGGNNRIEKLGNIKYVFKATDLTHVSIYTDKLATFESGAPFANNKSFIRFYDKNGVPYDDLGDTVIEGWSFATGLNNKALGLGSLASGNGNIADGAYSSVSGRSNQVGFCSVAGGRANKVGQYGAAFGEGHNIEAFDGFATGYYNNVYALGGFTSGRFNKATKDIYTDIPLADGVANTNAGVSIQDNKVVWDLSNTSNDTMRHFMFSGERVGTFTYQLNFQLDTTASYEMHALKSSDYVTAVGEKASLGSGTIVPTNGCATITRKITLAADKPYLDIRFTNTANATVTLTSAYIVTEEHDPSILYSIGNGLDNNRRSNAMVVYTDGHGEIQKTGETAKSIVTKEYIDAVTADTLTQIQTIDSNLEEVTSDLATMQDTINTSLATKEELANIKDIGTFTKSYFTDVSHTSFSDGGCYWYENWADGHVKIVEGVLTYTNLKNVSGNTTAITNNSNSSNTSDAYLLTPYTHYKLIIEYEHDNDVSATLQILFADTTSITSARKILKKDNIPLRKTSGKTLLAIELDSNDLTGPQMGGSGSIEGKYLFFRVQCSSDSHTTKIHSFTIEKKKDITLAVGNGTSDEDRKNAFAVYKDGHAEVQTVGNAANSVVNKEYADSRAQLIIGTENEDSTITTYNENNKYGLKIYVGANAPADPTEGVIWIKPINQEV